MQTNRSILPMKQSWLYSITGLLLLGAALYFYITEGPGTLTGSPRNFSIKDTAAITGIRFVKDQDTIHLSKRTNQWFIGKQAKAGKKVYNLLGMLSRLNAGAPVSDKYKPVVLDKMEKEGIAVNIYRDGQLRKAYTVLHDSIGGSGSRTFMKMNGHNQPFVVDLPGQDASITAFFVPNPSYWRSKVLFTHQFSELTYIQVKSRENARENYTLRKKGKNAFQLQYNDQVIQKVDEFHARSYFYRFSRLHFDAYPELSSQKVKQIKQKKPLYTITIKEKHTPPEILKGFRIPANDTSGENNEQQYDPYKMYVWSSKLEQLVIVKYLKMDHFIKDVGYFLQDSS